jgi:hypothetical protein
MTDQFIKLGQLISAQPRRMGKLTGITRSANESKTLIVAALLLIVTLLIMPAFFLYQLIETDLHCAQWKTKTVWQPSYTSYYWAGKMMMPMYHSAGWVPRDFCVQPK